MIGHEQQIGRELGSTDSWEGRGRVDAVVRVATIYEQRVECKAYTTLHEKSIPIAVQKHSSSHSADRNYACTRSAGFHPPKSLRVPRKKVSRAATSNRALNFTATIHPPCAFACYGCTEYIRNVIHPRVAFLNFVRFKCVVFVSLWICRSNSYRLCQVVSVWFRLTVQLLVTSSCLVLFAFTCRISETILNSSRVCRRLSYFVLKERFILWFAGMFLSLFNFSRINWFLYDVADLWNNGKA